MSRDDWGNDDEGEAEGRLDSGFLVTLAAAFMAIFLGTYFFMDDGLGRIDFGFSGSNEAFVSEADRACLGLWRDEQNNHAALNCYLTKQVRRLCDPQERSHLKRFISKYREHAGAYKRSLIADLEQAKRMAPLTNPEPLDEPFGAAERIFDAMVRLDEAVESTEKAETSHSQKLQSLAELGFVSEGDFGWRPDKIVKSAFAKAKLENRDPCAQDTSG